MNKAKQTADVVVTTDAKRLWKRFELYFWILFIIHLIPKLFSGLVVATNKEVNGFFIIALGITLIVALAMVINIGLHAYLLSKKKIYVLFGLLGLWWIGTVGIFIAYFAVKWIYYKSINKRFPFYIKIIAGLLVATTLLITLSLPLVLSDIQKISTNNTNSTSQTKEWATITTPDRILTMSLPKNPTYEYTKAGNKKVGGYSYISEEYNGRVTYIVKSENWKPIVDIKSLDDKQLEALLKSNVGLNIKGFKVSNFVSEFTFSHDYRAMKFSGQIKKDNSTATVQGISMFVGGHLYTFVALVDPGYSSNFKRLVNGISFNPLGL